MKTPIEQFIDSAHEIRLTSEASRRIREKLIVHMRANPVATKPIQSPYHSFFTILSPLTSTLRMPAMALALILVVTIGGATAFAAAGTLPGDTLYPVKVNVIEPVRGLMAVSPKAKAVWHTSVIEERLNEVEKLAKKDRLTSDDGTRSKERFDRSIDEVRLNIEELSQDDPETAKEIDELLEVSLSRHEKALKEVEVVSSSTSSIEAGLFSEHIRKGSRNKRERDSEDNR